MVGVLNKFGIVAKLRHTLIILGVLFVGILIGTLATSWAFKEFYLEPQAISASRVAIATKVAVLKELREGQMDKAMLTLETLLDGDLIELTTVVPDYRLDKQTSPVLKLVSDYRAKYPHVSSESDVNGYISTLLSRQNGNEQ